MLSHARRAWRKLSLSAAAALLATAIATGPAHAVYEFEVLGGSVEVTGFLQSEMRAVFRESLYVNQWIQRLQVESTITWEEVGFIDELAFTALVRPEFDVAYYWGSLSGGHTGIDATKGNYLGDPVKNPDNFLPEQLGFAGGTNDTIGFRGLDFALGSKLSTGGLAKNVEQGLPGWNNKKLKEDFKVLYQNSTFPLVAPSHQQKLNCHKCIDIDNSETEVAMNNTDSSGELYPFRELYMDATVGDWWLRVGKQQIVWGKTDFFRMQDIINPVDFGPHFFFDSFEDIRIPQWIMSLQYRPGSVGPFTDTAVQFIWNFDQFTPVGLGNPSGSYSHPFGKENGVFALFNTYFAAEPCLGLPSPSNPNGVAAGTATSCYNSDGSRNGKYASGFGIPAGLSEWNIPNWSFSNTEVGLRLEGRLFKVRLAGTAYWGFQDIEVAKGQNTVISAGLITNGNALANDTLWADLAASIGLPAIVDSPGNILRLAASQGATPAIQKAAQDALDNDNNEFFFASPDVVPGLFGGNVAYDHKRNLTLGLAVDYFEDFTGIVFRIESSYTLDELVQNTRKRDFTDETDVLRFSIGMDRPTFIKFLNPNRTFFLSAQIFQTWWIDHDGDRSTGMLNPEREWIYTFFAQGQYLRDRLTPQAFIVWEQKSNGWIGGFQVQYLFNNNWSAVFGGNFTWQGQRNKTHDVLNFTAFTLDAGQLNGNGLSRGYVQESVFGPARRGAAVFNDNSEFFFRVRYQF